MLPSRDDVQSMVVALFTLNAGLDRARRRSKGASTLSLLQVLSDREGTRPSALAEALQVHPSLVTRQVQELEDVGFVEVTTNPADARSFLVALTPAGVEEQQRLRQIGLDRFALFVAGWEADEVRMLTSLLEKLERSKGAVAAEERETTGHRRRGRTRGRARQPNQPARA
ncbi:MAG: MarR family transcriptional regulator [Solirubrobacteraceae bacterium]